MIITIAPAGFVMLVTRQTTPTVLFVTGKTKVKGDLAFAFVDEIFRRMSDYFVPERAKNIDVVVSWRFTIGDGEDGFDRFQTVIEDGIRVSGETSAVPRTPRSPWPWRTSSG